jgi:hypothetical protein
VTSLNDWEVDDLVSLYSLLYSYNSGGGVDNLVDSKQEGKI